MTQRGIPVVGGASSGPGNLLFSSGRPGGASSDMPDAQRSQYVALALCTGTGAAPSAGPGVEALAAAAAAAAAAAPAGPEAEAAAGPSSSSTAPQLRSRQSSRAAGLAAASRLAARGLSVRGMAALAHTPPLRWFKDVGIDLHGGVPHLYDMRVALAQQPSPSASHVVGVGAGGSLGFHVKPPPPPRRAGGTWGGAWPVCSPAAGLFDAAAATIAPTCVPCHPPLC